MTAFAPARQPRVLSIMPTFQCTAACTDCGTFSSPAPRHASLDSIAVERAINEAAEAGYVGVVFTGGEATLAIDIVLAGLRQARARGLGTRIVTNAHWAETDESARSMLRRLRGAGLDELNFSTGDQHARFVPVTSVVRAAVVALELGFRVICIMVEVTADRRVSGKDVTENPRFQAALEAQPAAHVQIIESPWMPTRHDKHHSYPPDYLLNSRTLSTKSGCSSCLRTTTVQADGRIAACCGLGIRTVPELQIGHIDSTSLQEADRVAGDDFLKRWIRVEGPEKILAWAASIDPEIEWEDMYSHKCQPCLRLYKDARVGAVITEHHQSKVADVLLGEFLTSHFEPPEAGAFPAEQPGF